jgi:MarR family transcriptional regulator, organic hydroperoxide resistance regulator
MEKLSEWSITVDDQTHEELVSQAMEQYRCMFHSIKAQASPVLKNIDLTLAQLRTLVILAEEGPLVIGQIAQRLGVGLSTGGHLVDRLVQAGLAERAEDAEDRRRTVARLTPAGEDVYTQLRMGPQRMQALLCDMNEEDLKALLQGLRAINRVIEQKLTKQSISS